MPLHYTVWGKTETESRQRANQLRGILTKHLSVLPKSFLWSDKSGSGDTATVLFTNIGFDVKEVNHDGITLYEWAENAGQGEEWENATDKYICTKS